MAIDSKQPLYSEFEPDWELMRDTRRGQRHIKDQGVKYLPPTPGQVLDGMESKQIGLANYQAYKLRAQFPDFVQEAVRGLLGVMNNKPATIELPTAMEDMRESVTPDMESLQDLLMRMNEEQLTTGRLGLMLDVPTGAPAGVLPYVVLYTAEDVINWDSGNIGNDNVTRSLNLVVLDETDQRRVDDFEWEVKQQYRVLVLGDVKDNENDNEGFAYRVGVFEEDQNFSEGALIVPSIAGNTLEEIPFVFCNTTDIVPEPENPPLLGLANLSVSVYRSEADYRQSLFMQGQDTLVIIGGTLDRNTGDNDGDGTTKVGAGAKIEVELQGDAKYIGVASEGLPEMRTALENDRENASSQGAQILNTTGGEAESGEALRIRVSARTATLNQIALTAATALQTILRIAAEWIGANPEEVIVTPNLDFTDQSIDGQTLVAFMTAKQLGFPISKQSLHRLAQMRDLTELEFEEEVDLIEQEEPETPGGGGITPDPDPEE